MNKKEMFRVLAKGSREWVLSLAAKVEENHQIVLVKEPAKTLVMLKMREPVADSVFFFGELLACEAMVRIGDRRGMALTAGDDFEKVLAMAVLDAAFNAGVSEVTWLTAQLNTMKEEIDDAERKEFSRHLQSKVQFRVMEGQ